MSSIIPIFTTPSEIFSCAWTAKADASTSVAAAAIKADFLMLSSRPAGGSKPDRHPEGGRRESAEPRRTAGQPTMTPAAGRHLISPAAARQAGLTEAGRPAHHRSG